MQKGFTGLVLLLITGTIAIVLLYIAFTEKEDPKDTPVAETPMETTDEEATPTLSPKTGTQKPVTGVPTGVSTSQPVQYTLTPTPTKTTTGVTSSPTPTNVSSPTPTKKNNGGGPDFPIVGG